MFLSRFSYFLTVFKQYLILKSMITKSRDTQKLLAVAFAFVMVASLAFPAYAVRAPEATSIPASPTGLATTESDNPIIYQNGNNPILGGGLFIDDRIVADDFVLPFNNVVTDAHFAFICTDPNNCPNIEPLLYFILADNGGLPGAVIDSGTGVNVMVMQIGDPNDSFFEVWFDFENGVPLDGGTTYWFGLKYTAAFGFIDPEPQWLLTDVITGNTPALAFVNPPAPGDWGSFSNVDIWFQLTGDTAVGGEFLPIDSTALMLAGLQSSAIWLLPVLAGIAGTGFYLVKFRTNKE